jgi:hypothetical protein
MLHHGRNLSINEIRKEVLALNVIVWSLARYSDFVFILHTNKGRACMGGLKQPSMKELDSAIFSDLLYRDFDKSFQFIQATKNVRPVPRFLQMETIAATDYHGFSPPDW